MVETERIGMSLRFVERDEGNLVCGKCFYMVEPMVTVLIS